MKTNVGKVDKVCFLETLEEGLGRNKPAHPISVCTDNYIKACKAKRRGLKALIKLAKMTPEGDIGAFIEMIKPAMFFGATGSDLQDCLP